MGGDENQAMAAQESSIAIHWLVVENYSLCGVKGRDHEYRHAAGHNLQPIIGFKTKTPSATWTDGELRKLPTDRSNDRFAVSHSLATKIIGSPDCRPMKMRKLF